MLENLRTIIAKLIQVLPDCPILAAVGNMVTPTWMGYLNYFVPITLIAEITKGWCLCIVIYRVAVYAKRKGSSFFDVLGGNS